MPDNPVTEKTPDSPAIGAGGNCAKIGGLTPVRKPRRVRRLGMVETAPLSAALKPLSQQFWLSHDAAKENRYWCFKETQHIIFRFIFGNQDPRNFYSEPSWPIFRPLLEPILRQATEAYCFVAPIFPKIMLARLLAGGTIPKHSDNLPAVPYTHKLHVPLETNPHAVLTVGGKQFHLEAGCAYEVNNLAPHGAHNGGSRDRVHLIFEVFDAAS